MLFDIPVRGLDKPIERCGIHSCFPSQLYVAHELACALQKAGRIRQLYAAEEPHIHVRGEHIDVAEGCIAQACDWTAVMQYLSNLVATCAHHLKPFAREHSQVPFVPIHPYIDSRVAFEGTVQSQQLLLHHQLVSRSRLSYEAEFFDAKGIMFTKGKATSERKGTGLAMREAFLREPALAAEVRSFTFSSNRIHLQNAAPQRPKELRKKANW
jgi:uncharacterized protein (UPF0332 family)